MLQTLLDRLENLAAAFGYWLYFLRPWHHNLERLAAELGLEPPSGAAVGCPNENPCRWGCMPACEEGSERGASSGIAHGRATPCSP